MKKYIEVIITKNRYSQNNEKTIKQVTRGYAFNYLIPNKIAEIATKGKIKHIQMLNNLAYKKKAQINLQDLKISNSILNARMIHLRKKCSQSQQIFGSVSEQDIQEIILHTIGQKIDKKQISIQTIKKIGTYICYIIINDNIKTAIKVRILPNRT